MPEVRHLRSAPITEAIFDIRVKARGDFRADKFLDLKPRLSERFPKLEERLYGQLKIHFESATKQPFEFGDSGLHGYFFKSEDEKLIAQFRIDGFTLNRLKPYTSWNELFPVVTELWNVYVTFAKPEAVTRLALRYINHIPLPTSFTHLDEFLHAPPSIPSELPQNITTLFARATISSKEGDISANVTQKIDRQEKASGVILIFDIDAFRDLNITPHDPVLMETFYSLREFKNLIFFSYLTENTIRRFE